LDGSTGGLPANLRLIAAAIVVICSQSVKMMRQQSSWTACK